MPAHLPDIDLEGGSCFPPYVSEPSAEQPWLDGSAGIPESHRYGEPDPWLDGGFEPLPWLDGSAGIPHAESEPWLDGGLPPLPWLDGSAGLPDLYGEDNGPSRSGGAGAGGGAFGGMIGTIQRMAQRAADAAKATGGGVSSEDTAPTPFEDTVCY